jgi:hypothetical protein
MQLAREEVARDVPIRRWRRRLAWLLELEPGLVFFQELLYVIGRSEQAVPLLVVQRDRETA